MKRTYARETDEGLEIRYVEPHQVKPDGPWKEVPMIRNHLSEKGLASLQAGESVTFTQQDQSYPALAALFTED